MEMVELPDSGRVVGIAMDFPASDSTTSCPPPRVPSSLRRRLSESKTTSPLRVEQIESKLRDADLRRQKFYENLSSKAQPKPRSPSQSLLHEDDLGQRLEARLQAAEQKRLSILAKAQMRLAKLNELRQAAKTGVEMRLQKECMELGTKVETRVMQAEANRMIMLKAYRQKRATVKERTSQSLLRRMARENKYKECVRAAIHKKWAAAEKKRLVLLEEEKKKAHARVLKVQKIAKSVSHQREIERRRMKDRLEDRLQRAKRQRAEYLMHKGGWQSPVHVKWKVMHMQADFLSRKLASCWRQFLKLKRTSSSLANDYNALNINKREVKSMPFEQLALIIESDSTLRTTKTLLDRLESRYNLSIAVSVTNSSSRWENIDHLLIRVASPIRRATNMKSTQSRDIKKPRPIQEAVKSAVKLSRYQVRIVLCAYMIVSHPDAVFSDQGEHEISLAKSAEKFIQEFELLIKIILAVSKRNCEQESDPVLARLLPFRSQLAAFDEAWCSYLNNFVLWKVKDAQLLEEDLIGAACQLEHSMIQTCKLTPEGKISTLTHDMKAIQKQVTENQKLLKQKVHHLSGDAGIQRLESALSDSRTKYTQAKVNGSPIGYPVAYTSFPGVSSSSASLSVASRDRNDVTQDTEQSSIVVRSLFKDDAVSTSNDVGLAVPGNGSGGKFLYYGDNCHVENELIVNELLHGQHHTFSESTNVPVKDKNSILENVREAMEKVFWDDIMDSINQDEPNFDRIVDLTREVRDGICEMAPQSWKQEIVQVIDLEIVSQLMNVGELDIGYLGKMLEFALISLQKLSAQTNEDELKTGHHKFLKELAEMCHDSDGSNGSHVVALIWGLRFVLEQIQALKQEISKARIRLLEPLLKGPAGLEYLEKKFTKCYGPPSNASAALPLTALWLVSVSDSKDQEWDEHTNALSKLAREYGNSPMRLFPSISLRTGGSFSVKTDVNQGTLDIYTTEADNQHPECKGEKIDLLVRLGLLKLVSKVSGLTQEELPETLKLNLFRLRSVQAQIQKIIVISTSILVLQQTLLSEKMVDSSMDSMVLNCVKRLSEFLDNTGDAGTNEIIEILIKVAADDDKKHCDAMKVKSMKELMSRMLTRSLQAGDAIFVRMSRAVYLAARGIVLGGSRETGRKLTEMALRQVGASILVDMVVEVGTVLVVVASVSHTVHGPWYAHLVDNM